MKKMIRMAAMAAAMFVAVTTVAKAQDAAQQGRGRGGNPSARILAALDSVHASDAIKAKADSIVKATMVEMGPLNEAARGGDTEAGAKVAALRTKQNEAIKALLSNDADKATFDRLTAMRGRRGGGF